MQESLLLLQQIADNTGNNSNIWVASISGGCAVMGATVSAILSFFITKRTIHSQEALENKKIRSSIVTTERLRWLKDLRSRISEFYTQVDLQYSIIQRPIEDKSLEEIQKTLDDYSQNIILQANMITLMLNDQDKDQKRLIFSIQKALEFMQDCFNKTTQEKQQFDHPLYVDIKTNTFYAANDIGNETWRQITELE